MKKMQIFKFDEWDLILDKYFDYDRNIYVDRNNKPITGFLEDFHYSYKSCIDNYQYVEDGKRSDRFHIKDVIPNGQYCYHKPGRRDSCPFWELRNDKPERENGYCSFLRRGDWEVKNETSLLWDQVKECEINMDEEVYISNVRSSIKSFAVEMEKTLRQHDEKKGEDGWLYDSIEYLLKRLQEEVRCGKYSNDDLG